MPHFIVEATQNLKSKIQWQPLFQQVHQTLADTGIFPLGGIRSRVHWVEDYFVADGKEEDAFIHIQLRIGAGRSLADLQPVGEQIFQLLTTYLQPLFDQGYFALSFEITEIHPQLNFKKNNIHLRFKK